MSWLLLMVFRSTVEQKAAYTVMCSQSTLSSLVGYEMKTHNSPPPINEKKRRRQSNRGMEHNGVCRAIHIKNITNCKKMRATLKINNKKGRSFLRARS